MKTIVLFFLLLNAAYFYFQTEGQSDSVSSNLLVQPVLPPGAKSLVLLRERGLGSPEKLKVDSVPSKNTAPDSTNVVPASAAEKVKTPQQTIVVAKEAPPEKKRPPKLKKSTEQACFTFGPFTKSKLVAKATKAASALGVHVEQRQQSKRTPKGYWVYLPASKSYQAAKRKITQLKKKGLKDLFIMGKGARKNAISLGLFKSKKTAEDRFKQVKKLGLKATFETQYRLSEQSWLDMSVAGDQTAAVASLTEVAENFSGASLVQRKCQ